MQMGALSILKQKLFSCPIFNDINPGGSLAVQNGYLLLTYVIALCGYCASAVIDKPVISHLHLQLYSFAISAVIFLLTSSIINKALPGALIVLYFLSDFFRLFGSNVTDVMATETYPIGVHRTCHGLSAFWG